MSSNAFPSTQSFGTSGSIQPFQSPASPPLSYLSARRPSLPQNTYSTHEDISHLPPLSGLRNETSHELDSPEDDGKFKQSIQIDMKSMVGDSVGNVSASDCFRCIRVRAHGSEDEHKPYKSRHSTCCVRFFTVSQIICPF